MTPHIYANFILVCAAITWYEFDFGAYKRYFSFFYSNVHLQ